MIKCPNCSAELKFNVKTENIKCEYCKSVFSPKELIANVKEAKIQKGINTISGTSYTCSMCGAEILTFDDTAVTFCSYCGSQAMLEGRLIKINNPDFIIPFKKTKEECIKAYKRKLNKSLFVPNFMKKDIVLEKFRGIYMPYAVYKSSFHGIASNSGSVYKGSFGGYSYYNDYDVKAEVDADYEGISYDLTSKFRDDLSQEIPFDFHDAIPFNLNYLLGFYADLKDIDENLYIEYAKEEIRNDCNHKLRKKRKIHRYGCTNAQVPLRIKDIKIGMFPVYFLSIKDRNNNYHYAVVNGQTGSVTMDLPIDFKKYVIGSLIIGIVLFLFINNHLVFKPKDILVFAIIMVIINMIISRRQIKKLTIHEKCLNDVGLNYLNNNFDIYSKKGFNNLNVPNGLIFVISIYAISLIGPLVFWIILGIKTLSQELGFNIYLLFSIFIFLLTLIFYLIRKNRKKKGNLKENDFFKTEWLKMLGLFIAGCIYIINSPYDEVYYGVSLMLLLIVIISFYDIVKKYNLIASRKFPQLEKRGGKNE